MAHENEKKFRNEESGKDSSKNELDTKTDGSGKSPDDLQIDKPEISVDPLAPTGEDGKPLNFEEYDHSAAQNEVPSGYRISEAYGRCGARFDPDEMRVQPSEFYVCDSHRFRKYGRL